MNLQYKIKNGWEVAQEEDKKQIDAFCDHYKNFLDNGKTERECAIEAIKIAENAGFKSIKTYTSLKAGDKVYINNRDKCVMFAVIGQDDIANGTHIIASHIDSPRIDLKQNPLYEDLDMALLKTHYYGGIKKYQWTTIPLAIHGIVAMEDGSTIEIKIGEDENDPIFCITDLLPHLSQDQMDKKLKDAITGESLNILIGSKPNVNEKDTEKKDKVKNAILTLLNEKYGMIEEDFLSAELEVVPSGKARDLGFDRSMIAAYGQDDRVCSYAALRAIIETDHPKRTAICLLADKEEVGSMGNTGMKSRFFEDSLAKILSLVKNNYTGLMLRETLGYSDCLSADVGAAVDPNYKDVQELANAPHLNYGVMLTKYTGSRGKSDSSDASAEFIGKIRKMCNDNKIIWQIGELGKVDQGGGGTVAQYIANLNVDTVDFGVPLLSMHSPLEVAGKMDIYMAYKAYRHFYHI